MPCGKWTTRQGVQNEAIGKAIGDVSGAVHGGALDRSIKDPPFLRANPIKLLGSHLGLFALPFVPSQPFECTNPGVVLAEVIGHGDAFTGTLSTVPIAKTALAMSLQRVAVSVRLSSFPLLLLLVQAPRDEGIRLGLL